MKVRIYYVDNELSPIEIKEEIRRVEKIEEIYCNLGTYIEITDADEETTNYLKRRVTRIEIE